MEQTRRVLKSLFAGTNRKVLGAQSCEHGRENERKSALWVVNVTRERPGDPSFGMCPRAGVPDMQNQQFSAIAVPRASVRIPRMSNASCACPAPQSILARILWRDADRCAGIATGTPHPDHDVASAAAKSLADRYCRSTFVRVHGSRYPTPSARAFRRPADQASISRSESVPTGGGRRSASCVPRAVRGSLQRYGSTPRRSRSYWCRSEHR